MFNIQSMILNRPYYLCIAITLIISVWLHEYAHAWSANRLGDPTPRLQWRLTPNPFAHIDPVWFIAIFLIWFGRWRAVQFNPYYFKNPIKDEMKVAFAGPITNIILSIISIIVMFVYIKIAWYQSEYIYNLYNMANSDWILYFLLIFSTTNIWLAVFNMLPIPPLDGFRVFFALAPRVAQKINLYINQFPIILPVIVFYIFGGYIASIVWSVSSLLRWFLYQIIGYFFL